MRVKAATAWREDIGAGFIRIPKLVRDAIGVGLGDKVLARGPRGEVVLTAIIADRTEMGKRVAGIDAGTRRALGVELGAYITVHNPQQAAHASPTNQWLFSYGSNNPDQLAERLGHPVSNLRAAYLPDYQLRFLGYSTNRQGGVAGVVPKRGAEVCGYVAQVNDEDLAVMDTYEGIAGRYYVRKRLWVMVEDDESGDFTRVRATVYVAGRSRLEAEHHYPSEEYLEAVEKTIFGFWDEDGECRDYLDSALEEVLDIRRRNPYRRNAAYGPLSKENPELEKDWDAEKNWEELGLRFEDPGLSPGSDKKVYWKCHVCDHEWQTRVGNRARGGRSCPRCAGRLQQSLSEANPELQQDWDAEKNWEELGLRFEDPGLRPGSDKKVYWKCHVCDHEWRAPMSSCARKKVGCPRCAGRLPQSLSEANPELKQDWDAEKNWEELGLRFEDPGLRPGSGKGVYWKCHVCNHEWRAQVSNRARKVRGCARCAGRLPQSLSEANPELETDWDAEKNWEELGLRFEDPDLSPGSDKKVYWKCHVCNHEWQTRVGNRARRGTGCRECHLRSKRKPNRIKKFDGKGCKGSSRNSPRRSTRGGSSFDIGPRGPGNARRNPYRRNATYGPLSKENPELKQDWDAEKNWEELGLRFEDPGLRPGSHKKVYWKCHVCDHEWQTKVGSRAMIGKGCSRCAGRLPQSLSEANPELKQDWDAEKNWKELGLRFEDLRLRPGSRKKVYWKCHVCDHEWQTVVANRARGRRGCKRCAGFLPQSLSEANPELQQDWDMEKNWEELGLRFEDPGLSPGSGKRVYWKCHVCRHEWRATVTSRARGGAGCKRCAGFLPQSLSEANPELEKDWDAAKNWEEFGLRFEDPRLRPGSNKQVYWKCHVCDHEWQATVNSRARRGTGCRDCYLRSVRKPKKIKKFDGTGRKGSSRNSPRRSTRGGSSFDIGPGNARRNPRPWRGRRRYGYGR